MTGLLFLHQALAVPYAISVGAVAGAVFGYIHFQTLKWNTDLYAEGNVWKAVALQIVRFVLMIAVLVCLAVMGAWTLLSALASLLIVRAIVLRRQGQSE